MCLAIPGQVIELLEVESPFTAALVEFAGVRRQVSLACVPDAVKGDYVLVHAGVAISRINADEAAKVLAALEELDLDDELLEEPAAELGQNPR
ncbi:MAG TPA: HypC/HybG/HupF family hydrogenase formation chaperone [Lacipirellulaceae bacterium]|jgi:hydrogenase expression/formation protein HypC|nr:HypC/HybG/HupF family hydrogenase formation chaperone [Lacipirellulaceae bacterium]